MAKMLTGIVVSTKMSKTVVVAVERKSAHPLYRKTVTTSKRYKVRIPEHITVAVGDHVIIRESRPLSRDIRFVVDRIMSK